MPYLFNLVYLVTLLLASPWLLFTAIRKGKYREGFRAKFFGAAPRRTSNRPCIWFHAVSVGEVNLLQPLLVQCEQLFPNFDCVISTTTKTGFDLARQKYSPRTVFYCPLDFSWAVKNALRRVRPDLLVLAELELWPNLLNAAKQSGVQVTVVNGRLSEKSFRGYSRLKWLTRWMLSKVDVVAAQSETYAQRFIALGAPPSAVTITGSIKFDGAPSDRDNPATVRLARLANMGPQDIVFLAGSTQSPEESLAIETFRDLRAEFPQLRLILVPRHPDRFDEVAKLLEDSGLPWQRRSRIAPTSSTGVSSQQLTAEAARILLVDTIGELGAWWGTAHIAFVGGSMGTRGGQNMIEPAAYGAAVSFGPHTKNFRDVVELLLSHNAATVVGSGEELQAWVRRCLTEPNYTQQMGATAQSLVRAQQGATAATMQLLRPLLAKNSPPSAARHRAA